MGIDHRQYCPMSSLNEAVTALSNEHFWQQSESFWQLVDHLFVDYHGSPVWTSLPFESLGQLARHLHAVIETMDTIEEVQGRASLIYQTYFAILTRIVGAKTCSEWMATENPQVLKSVHCLYRTLIMLKASPLPLFGHVK